MNKYLFLLKEEYLKWRNPLIRKIKNEKLTYLSAEALIAIQKSITEVEKNKIPGVFVECGCALGGSTIVIAQSKNQNRIFKVYDVFGMIPPPSDKDGSDIHQRYEMISKGNSKGIDGAKYYGYRDDLLEEVIESLKKFKVHLQADNIQLIQGLFQDTLIIDQAIAWAHLDGDWYESTMVCLERIVPRLSKGGKIVVDDYHDWSGCRKAVDEYFADRKTDFEWIEIARKLHITKK